MWDKLSRAGLERIRSRCAPDHPTAISLLLPGTAKRTGMRVPMLLARCAFSWLLGGVCCRPVRVSAKLVPSFGGAGCRGPVSATGCRMEARVSSRVLDGRVRASRSEHFLCDVCAHGGRYLYLDTADDLRKHLRCGRAAPSSAPHVPKQAYVHAAAPALPPHAVQGCADAAMNALHWPAQFNACIYALNNVLEWCSGVCAEWNTRQYSRAAS